MGIKSTSAAKPRESENDGASRGIVGKEESVDGFIKGQKCFKLRGRGKNLSLTQKKKH